MDELVHRIVPSPNCDERSLPVRPPAGMRAEHFRELMSLDKKVAAGQLRLILMRQLAR